MVFLADLIVVVHLAFIVFVVCGGLLAFRWRWIPWLHLPAAAWGALVEFRGWLCPLTPLENRLRQADGARGYSGGFIENYVLPIVYPAELSRDVQLLLGLLVCGVNLAVYSLVWLARSTARD